jgi:ABC-type lipoprotein release transport system permease subunit
MGSSVEKVTIDARTGIQIGMLGVLLSGVAGGAVWATNIQRDVREIRESVTSGFTVRDFEVWVSWLRAENPNLKIKGMDEIVDTRKRKPL